MEKTETDVRRRGRAGGQTALPKDAQRCVLEGSPKFCQILMDTEGGNWWGVPVGVVGAWETGNGRERG